MFGALSSQNTYYSYNGYIHHNQNVWGIKNLTAQYYCNSSNVCKTINEWANNNMGEFY